MATDRNRTMLTGHDIVDDYLVAAVWSSLDYDRMEDGNPLPLDESYDVDDFTDDALASALADCDDFLDYVRGLGIDLDGLDAEQVGHDFWLSRNGHGAGFFDRGLGERGDALQDAARTFGDVHLYGDGTNLHYDG